MPLSHNLCLDLQNYSNQKHRRSCGERHELNAADAPEFIDGKYSIGFRVMHVYSPVYYKVQLLQQNDREGVWRKVPPTLVDVFVTLKIQTGQEAKELDMMGRILDRLSDPQERYSFGFGKVLLKSKYIYFVKINFELFSLDLPSCYKQSSSLPRRVREMFTHYISLQNGGGQHKN